MFNFFKRRPKEEAKRNITKPLQHKRSFAAANMGRLFGAWTIENKTLDSDLRYDLRKVRARSRDFSINNDYYAKYLNLVCANVVGHNGIKMQPKVFDFRNGQQIADRVANDKIERAWLDWGKKCDVTGRLSWIDSQSLFIESVARDGEILVRKLRSKKYKYGFSLQFLEADLLDEDYNETLTNGNRIKMGVEVDSFGKPIAYHLFQSHPGDETYFSYSRKKNYIRIPAEDIIHAFLQERPVQTRGYPWGVAAFTRLKNLEGYEEAAITAARIGASKMGFYTSPDGKYTGDDLEGNNPIQEVEPGVFEVLPQGYDFKAFDPDYPAAEFDPFMKRSIKGIASGLNVPYVSLASDMEGVSYSSIRQGELEARDMWRTIQSWMIDNFCAEVFREWLMAALMTQELALPFEKFDKFNSVIWQARGWAWVDPSKDVRAATEEINAGLTTKTKVISERSGASFYDVQVERAEEKRIEKELGLTEEIKEVSANGTEEDEDDAAE